MVAPPWYEVPPIGYGGVELICGALVDALVTRGHDVTLFGAGTRTGTAATFVSTTEEPQSARLGEEMPAMLHAARVNRMLADTHFDIIHDHTLGGALTAPQRAVPTVVTVHGPTDGELGQFYAELPGGVHLVAISHSQRQQSPALPWAGTVHNAIDPDRFQPVHSPDGPVVWLARFSAEKGPDLAIRACRAAGLPLVLVGKCNEAQELRYLDEEIRPLLDEDVTLLVNADRRTVQRMLRAARCLILPIRWQEPFGMVMIEAMASGTPVVALRRGSVPELVRHGVTGWICDHPAELPAALNRVGELAPAACVQHVRDRFSAGMMARRYEQVYRKIIAQEASRRRERSGKVLSTVVSADAPIAASRGSAKTPATAANRPVKAPVRH
jgi:glycosyltransferase involved in cell wall biosynthesis